MIRLIHIIIAVVALTILSGVVSASESDSERFPPPEFETDYQRPSPTTPEPRQDLWEYVDVAVLVAALGLSSYLVLRKRNRRMIFLLTVCSLIYFGFWRKGCVCPIGAIQNMVLSVFDANYAVPMAVAAFFLLPLVFTLFFGRTFCAAVCPLGAMQDLVLFKPVSVPSWLESALRLLAYVYLGLAVLFAATGSAFFICRYDPFVAFFRVSGNFNILVLGACFLLIGMFVGRPYCRYVCPYGVILRQLSRLSKWRVTITPDDCIRCRLCEDSCPFGAIRQPTADWPARSYSRDKRRLVLLMLLLPVLMLAGGWITSALSPVTSRMHATVRLAERIYQEESGEVVDTTDASSAFRATGKKISDLYGEAGDIRGKFRLGGWFLGAFVGLMAGLKLISHSLRRNREDYEADRASCVACGRCFQYCPREHVRLKQNKTDRE